MSLEDANNQRTEIILPQYYIVNLSYFKSFNSKNYIKFGVKNLFDYIDENPSAPDFLASYDPGRRFYISLNFSLYKNKNSKVLEPFQLQYHHQNYHLNHIA